MSPDPRFNALFGGRQFYGDDDDSDDYDGFSDFGDSDPHSDESEDD